MIKKILYAYLKESNLYVWMMENQIMLQFNSYNFIVSIYTISLCYTLMV